jgi:hypothetical protein
MEDAVTVIGTDAFLSCTSLTSVCIPRNVTSIGDGAFYKCTHLTSVTFLGPTMPSDVGTDWIENTPAAIRGHAFEASNFPGPGGYFHGLQMSMRIGGKK